MSAALTSGSGIHELITLDEPQRWSAALADVPHAFAHSWEHCHAFALSSGKPTFLYHYVGGSTRVVGTLAERHYQGEPDVFTPYGFGGFASSGLAPEFEPAWREFAQARGWVCGYVQSHPLLRDPLIHDGLPEVPDGLFVLDLSPSDEELLRAMSASRRRSLTRGPATGTSYGLAGDDALGFLVREAPNFFEARSAARVYQFVPETWRALLAARGVLALAARRDGAVVAVTLFGFAGGIADYLFNVSTPLGQDDSAGLLWEGVRQLRQRGCIVMNLGGGIRPGDNVAEFKRRFGARRVSQVVHRQVFHRPLFEHLCYVSGVSADIGSGYFPPYHIGNRN